MAFLQNFFGMGINSFFHVLREYLDGTYQPQMFILAMELGIISISLSQVDLKIFGDLNHFFIKWHSIFLGPFALSAPLTPLFDSIWPGGKMPNMIITLISIIEISLFRDSPKLSFFFLILICLIYFIDNANSLITILFSILFGYSFFFLKEITEPSQINNSPIFHSNEVLQAKIRIFRYDYNECIYISAIILTLITILTQFRANNMKDTSNYHSILIRNLGFVIFDSVIHYYGTENYNYIMFAFCSNLFFNFLSNQMSSYSFSFSFF